jgi:glycosyltransferase involved in cell wall biosynthesis
MACGVPVITSNTTAIPEVVGDGARTVSPDDDLRLAEEMLELLTNDESWQTLQQKGFQRVAQFDWRKTAAQTLQAYYKLHQLFPIRKADDDEE